MPKSQKHPVTAPQAVTTEKLSDEIGLLRVAMFPGAIGIDVAKDIDRSIAALDGCSRLIVDLRGNTGGGIGGLRLMSYLTPGKLEVGYSLTRKCRERGYRREELTRFGRIPSNKATLIWLAARYAFVEKSILVVTEGLGQQRFQGRVVLLVNEHTASAGEMVSAFAEENNLATIVGTKTPGRLLTGSAYKVVGQVRIRVEACGVCHSDAGTVEGQLPGIMYPRVPGHEAIGRIEQIGPGVTNWKVGQRVGVGFFGGEDGTCETCRRGDTAYCQNPIITGVTSDGGYAEMMIAEARALVLIPEELKSEDAAPLVCAGITTFNALRNNGRAGDTVAIQGIGGLGHLGVQFARKMGFRTVAIGGGPDKEHLATKLSHFTPHLPSLLTKSLKLQ